MSNGSEGPGERMMDFIFLGIIGVLSLILMMRIMAKTGIGAITSCMTCIILIILGGFILIALGLWKWGPWEDLPEVENKHGGAAIAIGLFMILAGFSYASVESYDLGLQDSEACRNAFGNDVPVGDFESYGSQIKCIAQNPKVMEVTLLVFVLTGTVIVSFLPVGNTLLQWLIAGVLTLFAMRRPYILRMFGITVTALFGNFMLIFLIFLVVGAYVWWKNKKEEEALEEAEKWQEVAKGS